MRPYIHDPHEEILHSAVMIIKDPRLCLEFPRLIDTIYQLVVMFMELIILHLYLVCCLVKHDKLAICQIKLSFTNHYVLIQADNTIHSDVFVHLGVNVMASS